MSKILYLSELEEFFGGENWLIEINLVDIWSQYSNKEITLEKFNAEYYNSLVQNKNKIVGLGNNVWNDLVELLNNMKNKKEQKELLTVYEKIYDLADKNDILLKTK